MDGHRPGAGGEPVITEPVTPDARATFAYHSLPCPGCGARAGIMVNADEVSALDLRRGARGNRIQVVLWRFDANLRERFISGYCVPCWDKLFS